MADADAAAAATPAEHDHGHEHPDWWDEVVMPALLRSARVTYGMAMRRGLEDAGFDDVPRHGMALLGGIARNGPAAQQDLPRFLTTSKQTASQVVDTLVTRGYLHRTPDPDDRRRMVLTLTERGEAASEVSAGGVERVDAALARHFTAAELATTRKVLGTMIDIGERAKARRLAQRGETGESTDG